MVIAAALLDERDRPRTRGVRRRVLWGDRLRRAGAPTAAAQALRVHRARTCLREPLSASRSTEGAAPASNRSSTSDGWEIGAIYHSHTHTAPYPSQTDINFAANWPGVEWVIVGLAADEPEVRCYLIDGAEVREVALEVR